MNGIEFGTVGKVDILRDNIIIVGGGRSLTDFNFGYLKSLGHIITINDSGKVIPYADSWFTLDPWGLEGPQLPPPLSTSKLYAAVPDDFGTPNARSEAHRKPVYRPVTFLHRIIKHNLIHGSSDTAYKLGLCEDKDCISTGNSGYGALNLAYHMRPKRILLLGIDGDIGYYYDKTKNNRRLSALPAMFRSAIPQLEAQGITVVNGSIKSTVDAFPRMTVEDGLEFMNV